MTPAFFLDHGDGTRSGMCVPRPSVQVESPVVERHWQVNHQHVHPLWKRENMHVRRKQHHRRRFSDGSKNRYMRAASVIAQDPRLVA